MNKPDKERVVITGVGLTAPNGNSLGEFRQNLLNGVSGVKASEDGQIAHAGVAALGRPTP